MTALQQTILDFTAKGYTVERDDECSYTATLETDDDYNSVFFNYYPELDEVVIDTAV